MSHHKDYGIWPLHPQKHAHRLFFLFSPCKKTQHWKRSSLLNQISHREDSHSTSKTIKNNPISAHNHQILYIVIPLCKWPLMSVHHCTSEWHHYKKPHAKSDLAVAGQLVIMATIQDSIGLWWMYIYLISSFRFYRVTKKDLVMRPF